MPMKCSSWLVVFAVLAGCSSTVTPAPGDGGADGAPQDVTADRAGDAAMDYCVLPNGGRCPRGSSCPAGDGCNTCSCYGPGPIAACTLIGCVPPDAGARRCTRRADCGSGEFCQFAESSCGGTGTCAAAVPCAETVEYCDCANTSYLACTPDRPTARRGPCETFDAGTPGCRTTADCAGGRLCTYATAGCGIPGTCQFPRDCALITEYCGCDGNTFRDCPGGNTSQPYVSTGACPTATDGGTPMCAGAAIGPDGRSCLGPDDGSLPLSCCTWNCDVRLSPCDSLPPRCPPGLSNTVATPGCWGPCVPPTACRPMDCAPDNSCVEPWRCDPSTRRCVWAG